MSQPPLPPPDPPTSGGVFGSDPLAPKPAPGGAPLWSPTTPLHGSSAKEDETKGDAAEDLEQPSPERPNRDPEPAPASASGPEPTPPAPESVAPTPNGKGLNPVLAALGAMLLLVVAMVGYQYFKGSSSEDDQFDSDRSDEPITAAELFEEGTIEYDLEFTDGDTKTGSLTLLERIDHDDCASAAVAPEAEDFLRTCEHRVEGIFEAEDPRFRVSQQVFMFAVPEDAEDFRWAYDGQFLPDAVEFADPGDLENAGYTANRIGVDYLYVAVTLVVGDETVDSGSPGDVKIAEDHLSFRHDEAGNVLRVR